LFHARLDIPRLRSDLPRASVLMGVPTFYTRLLDDPDFNEQDCRNMRLFISGSAPLLAETFHAFAERSGHRILERYGMTEAGMIASNPLQGERIAGSVGYALPDVELRVVDESGDELAAEQIGQLEIRGPNVFRGYWRQAEKTAAEFCADGFFRTGDLAQLDATGRLTLVGRGKDLIIAGGYNIYPKEIETCLDSLEEIRESAVIGVADADLGEAVVALVVTAQDSELDEAAVLAKLAGQLARFKRPRRIIALAELPRNAMGKVQKQQLRETYADLFSTSAG
jgi:malonyl-CoA/methylmalonyl-CoA synthetase